MNGALARERGIERNFSVVGSRQHARHVLGRPTNTRTVGRRRQDVFTPTPGTGANGQKGENAAANLCVSVDAVSRLRIISAASRTHAGR